MAWFLYDNGLRHERVNGRLIHQIQLHVGLNELTWVKLLVSTLVKMN